MSWFSRPSEYRRYADGRVEIIERRSLLKISLALLGALTVAGGTAAVVMTKSPMSGGSQEQLNRHPALTQEVASQILREQDRDAVYRILGHYGLLDPIERSEFWGLVLAFELKDLRPYAELAIREESHPMVKAKLEVFLQQSR